MCKHIQKDSLASINWLVSSHKKERTIQAYTFLSFNISFYIPQCLLFSYWTLRSYYQLGCTRSQDWTQHFRPIPSLYSTKVFITLFIRYSPFILGQCWGYFKTTFPLGSRATNTKNGGNRNGCYSRSAPAQHGWSSQHIKSTHCSRVHEIRISWRRWDSRSRFSGTHISHIISQQ